MYMKEISKLKKKMRKECNMVIDHIIDQIIANEAALKVAQNNESASYKTNSLELKISLSIEDNIGVKTSIGSNQSAINMKD